MRPAILLALLVHSNAGMTTAANPEVINEQAAPKVGMVAVLIPILLSTLLTLSVVAGGVFWVLKHGVANAAAPAQAQQLTVVEAPPASHVLAMEPMIVNLSDAGGHSYLRASVSLRIKDAAEKDAAKKEAPKDPKAAEAALAPLRDTTLAVLSSKSSEELLAPDGREALKKALQHQYREHNPEVPVLDVYFTEFLVQRG